MYCNPYKAVAAGKGRWLKANFHTHAGTGPGTCGSHSFDEVIAAYKDSEYDLLTISNHDLYSDTREHAKKHDIAMINGFEYSAYPHMLCIGVQDCIDDNHQQAINATLAQGGFTILCHPNWDGQEYWSLDAINQLTGYTGIEIMNMLIFRLAGSGVATDKWDALLSENKLVWGFGNDDFHAWCDLGRSFTCIYAPSTNYTHVKDAIDHGSFFVSTGLMLDTFTFDGKQLTVKASTPRSYVKEMHYRFVGKDGVILNESHGEYGVYALNGTEPYVRVEVCGEQGFMLFTQPLYKKDVLLRP